MRVGRSRHRALLPSLLALLVLPLLSGPAEAAEPVPITAKLLTSHDWPELTPQGARWSYAGDVTVEDYQVTDPRQGGKVSLRSGNTKWFGIKAYRQALRDRGYNMLDIGVYTVGMGDAVRSFQRRFNAQVSGEHHLPVNGVIGFHTSRALLAPSIERIAQQHGVPREILCGHLTWESGLDPGAVGPGGTDLGLAQLSRRYHQEDYTVGQAFNKDTAIAYMAARDAAAMRRYDDWRIAVLSYWSPARAAAWARDGDPPDERAERYANGVLARCTTFPFDTAY